MATDVDIINRSLLMLGLQKRINARTQDTAEAKAADLIYSDVQNWCFGLFNWSFARKSTALTLTRTSTGVTPWNTTTQPSPPWRFEYLTPVDMVMPRWLTDPTAESSIYLGNPARFQMGYNLQGTANVQVILTNIANPILVYTALITDPTFWPWYFERLVVTALARSLCLALTGNQRLYEDLSKSLIQQIAISENTNRAQGLVFDDTTPEWVQALGINYPVQRNIDDVAIPGRRSKEKPNDNRG